MTSVAPSSSVERASYCYEHEEEICPAAICLLFPKLAYKNWIYIQRSRRHVLLQPTIHELSLAFLPTLLSWNLCTFIPSARSINEHIIKLDKSQIHTERDIYIYIYSIYIIYKQASKQRRHLRKKNYYYYEFRIALHNLTLTISPAYLCTISISCVKKWLIISQSSSAPLGWTDFLWLGSAIKKNEQDPQKPPHA